MSAQPGQITVDAGVLELTAPTATTRRSPWHYPRCPACRTNVFVERFDGRAAYICRVCDERFDQGLPVTVGGESA